MEKIYNRQTMEYGDKTTLDKYSGNGGYQRARKDGFEKTYDLEMPLQKDPIYDRDICTVNGKRVIIRGWQWVNKTDLGLFLGAGQGILLYPEKDADPYHIILKGYTGKEIVKERFLYEKTTEEKTAILAEREALEVEVGNRLDRVTPDIS